MNRTTGNKKFNFEFEVLICFENCQIVKKILITSKRFKNATDAQKRLLDTKTFLEVFIPIEFTYYGITG